MSQNILIPTIKSKHHEKDCTWLKNKDCNQLFYQSEWDKNISSWVILVFHFMFVAANKSKFICMDYLANIKFFLYHSNLSF